MDDSDEWWERVREICAAAWHDDTDDNVIDGSDNQKLMKFRRKLGFTSNHYF